MRRSNSQVIKYPWKNKSSTSQSESDDHMNRRKFGKGVGALLLSSVFAGCHDPGEDYEPDSRDSGSSDRESATDTKEAHLDDA